MVMQFLKEIHIDKKHEIFFPACSDNSKLKPNGGSSTFHVLFKKKQSWFIFIFLYKHYIEMKNT